MGSWGGGQEEVDVMFLGGLGYSWRSHPLCLGDGSMVLASSQVRGQRVIFGVSSLKPNTAGDPVLATSTRDTSALPLVSAPTAWVQYPT